MKPSREHLAVGVALGAALIAAIGFGVLHEDGTWWAVRVNGRTIGAEKVFLTPIEGGVHLVRNGSITGADGFHRTDVDVEVESDGHVRGTDAVALEVLAPTLVDGATAQVNVLDLYTRRGHVMQVTRHGDVVEARGDGIAVDVELRGGHVVRMVRGPVELVLVPMKPTVAPYDPSVFERPVALVPDAASVHHAVFRLDGADVIVDVPLALEVPRDGVTRLRAYVAEARNAGGDCQVQARFVVARATTDGLTAKVVEGWAYSDDDGTPALVPHAWAEVHLGDLTVPVDPALDQVVANALRLPAPPGESWFAEHEVVLIEAR